MIESIDIKNTATYGIVPQRLAGLSKINFLYGANGSGKTTISRLIANENNFHACSIGWKGNAKLQTLVYNCDFVALNFNQLPELKGIFTLGQQSIEALEKISTAKIELDEITKEISDLNITLNGTDNTSGKKGELSAIEEDFKKKCWIQKQKHDGKFSKAFEGFRGSSDKFKEKILQEQISNKSTLKTLEYIEKKAETVFGSTPALELSLPNIVAVTAIALESNPVLNKRVIGKDNVDITAMIKKLNNSDWVRSGRSFYDANNQVCPFCQQETTESFAKSLNEYFDESFIADSNAIEKLVTDYETEAARLQQQIASIIATPSRFLDIERFKVEKELLDSKITINNQRLASKKKEPSQLIELESIANVAATIGTLISNANEGISDHNKIVSAFDREYRDLTSHVWKYILETEINIDITAYSVKKSNLTKAISSLAEKITSKTADKKKKAAEIRDLEKETTSIQPTIDAINGLLLSFGFTSFTLAKASGSESYKLVRADGVDAKETLSEGEKTFVTFLYFYHLLKGSNSESGVTVDRIVVFDDPVSSLDSDILFLVSSLIKGIFEEVRIGSSHIKQLFIFTHNVYFHKEITFNSKRRSDAAMADETFWVVRKSDSSSYIEKHNSNPIKTSYDLLWSEVRRPDRSKLTIQNTLRRILENYFKILGGIDSDKICEKFEGKEKLICKSLFSWINDGSHFANDDLYISIDDSMVETYLNVFKAIFEKSKHIEHYKMMMGEAFVEIPAEELIA